MDIFRTLGNKNRRNIIKLLIYQEMHISAIAREINISTPVALRHINLLEKNGFIEKKKIGNSHIFSINKESLEKLEKIMDLLDDTHNIIAKKGENLSSVLKKVPGIKIEKTSQGEYISSVDKNDGYYIYELNSKLVSKSPDKIKIENDSVLELKRLMPVLGKKINIKIK